MSTTIIDIFAGEEVSDDNFHTRIECPLESADEKKVIWKPKPHEVLPNLGVMVIGAMHNKYETPEFKNWSGLPKEIVVEFKKENGVGQITFERAPKRKLVRFLDGTYYGYFLRDVQFCISSKMVESEDVSHVDEEKQIATSSSIDSQSTPDWTLAFEQMYEGTVHSTEHTCSS